MLTTDGRAPPFGDLAECAPAAGTDAGTPIQRPALCLRKPWFYLDDK